MNNKELRELHKPFSLSGLSSSMEDRLTLVGLLCYVTDKMREKDPTISCVEVLMKLLKSQILNDDQRKFIQALGIVCDDFMKNVIKFDPLGYKTSTDIKNKIIEEVNNWLPF